MKKLIKRIAAWAELGPLSGWDGSQLGVIL